MTKTGNVETLEELDAERKLVIHSMFGQDPARTDYLLKRYEKDCRAFGLDPDTWEGSGRAA